MTNPRYPTGCAEESQVREEAPVAWRSGARWIVNFNNGNSNNNDDDNQARVRAVRSAVPGECQGSEAITFKSLYDAFQRARKHKAPSANQLQFESRWIDGLLNLQARLRAGTWKPRPTNCFVAKAPKAREIHAPDFGDRVVHHWLVPQIEAFFDRGFIHDSFANRKGKGTHTAVDRLRDFVRQVDSGQGGGYFLQLDIRNYFNSIHRPTLWRLLKRKLTRHQASDAVLRCTHALVSQSVQKQGVIHRSTPAERALVPRHKRLEHAAPNCGLPIGNLSSQFFANVYLDQLDQFVKHTLKAPRYLRYVDDFVLVHHDRSQLLAWQAQIEQFLQSIHLQLKAGPKLAPLSQGIDFLGYVIYPTHTRVRRRVVAHAKTAIASWESRHVDHGRISATPRQYQDIRNIWASYVGHFQHADAHRLVQGINQRFPWLANATTPRKFHHSLSDQRIEVSA